MFIRLIDKFDNFCRWLNWRFLKCGNEIPWDILVWRDNIKRIVNYMPVLWRDWNFNCTPGMFELIKKKLELLEPVLINHTYANRDKKRIRICINLLDRIINHTDNEKFMEQHEKKWGKYKLIYKLIQDSPKMYESLHKCKNVNTVEQQKQESKEFLRGFKKAEQQHQKCIKLVVCMIGKYAEGWWD